MLVNKGNMSTIITHPPMYQFFDDYTAYEAKKKEVLDDASYQPGTLIIHTTPNQEGCETAVLKIVDDNRTLTIIRYVDNYTF